MAFGVFLAPGTRLEVPSRPEVVLEYFCHSYSRFCYSLEQRLPLFLLLQKISKSLTKSNFQIILTVRWLQYRNVSILEENFDILPNFEFLIKISIFNQKTLNLLEIALYSTIAGGACLLVVCVFIMANIICLREKFEFDYYNKRDCLGK